MASEKLIENIKNFMFKFKECTKKSGDRAKYIAVSKKKEFQYIKLAYDLGVKFFGENYPQELRDKNMQKINSYYFDLIKGGVLDSLKIRVIEKGGFVQHMKSIGKLGGQNKVPRLANDRGIANNLLNYEKKG